MYRNEIASGRMCNRMLSIAGAALLVCGTATAQSTTGAGGSNGTGMNNGAANAGTAQQNSTMAQNAQMGMGASGGGAMQDKKFAKAAMAGGMAEVQLGQLALQKSNSDDVKQFAQKMVDDHTKLNDQMKPIAMQLGVQPPTAPMPKDQALMTKLQGMQGDEFDKAYIKAMVKDHKKDDKEFEMEASSGQNPQEKEAAQQGDVIIKQHLQMIEGIAKAHNMGGKGMM